MATSGVAAPGVVCVVVVVVGALVLGGALVLLLVPQPVRMSRLSAVIGAAARRIRETLGWSDLWVPNTPRVSQGVSSDRRGERPH